MCCKQKRPLKEKREQATQAHLTHALASKELVAQLKRQFPSCHEHPNHLQISMESFARAIRCSPLCYLYRHRPLVEVDDLLDFFSYNALSGL